MFVPSFLVPSHAIVASQDAWKILSDPVSRRVYDEYGHAGIEAYAEESLGSLARVDDDVKLLRIRRAIGERAGYGVAHMV